MRIRARRAAKTDRAALALAGLGAADADKRHFVTSLTRTPPNNADHLVSPPRPDKDRLQRNIYACSEPFECDPFAADMLARALSVADGNAFFRAYDPAAYLPAKSDRKSMGDLAVQYKNGTLSASDRVTGKPRRCRRPDARFAQRSGERSPSGLGRRTGNAVWGNPSRVQIPPSPPLRRTIVRRAVPAPPAMLPLPC